jgi:H+/Cl- antiporter ClcA
VLNEKRSFAVLQEEFALIFAVLKWTALAIISGIIVGGGVTLFVEMLEFSIGLTSNLSKFWVYAALPLGLTASALSVHYLAPDASGHGTEKVVEAVHERAGDIELKVVPVKMLSTIFTVASGGSAGKEGPATQIAAGLTSTLARWMKFNDYDKKKLVVCGVSAGFAAVFGTPVAGAVFALEVLYIGKIFYDVLFPSFISGIVAWRTALWLGLKYGSFPIDAAAIPYTLSNFGWAMLAGCFFGLVALCFVELMNFCDNFFNNLRWPLVGKALLGAALIALLIWQVGPEYLGLSDGAMAEILRGRSAPFFAWLWKTLVTVLTLACGGSGGVVTPIFYIGAAAGSAFAALCGLNTAVYAAWGMVGVLAGCANAPISSTIMAVELFGGATVPFAAVLCVTAFIIVGHRSVYPSQLLERTKSSLLVFPEPGQRIDQVKIQVDLFRSPLLHKLHLHHKRKQQND